MLQPGKAGVLSLIWNYLVIKTYFGIIEIRGENNRLRAKGGWLIKLLIKGVLLLRDEGQLFKMMLWLISNGIERAHRQRLETNSSPNLDQQS
jgi:hypothetical protein